jgi:hypothetical protein
LCIDNQIEVIIMAEGNTGDVENQVDSCVVRAATTADQLKNGFFKPVCVDRAWVIPAMAAAGCVIGFVTMMVGLYMSIMENPSGGPAEPAGDVIDAGEYIGVGSVAGGLALCCLCAGCCALLNTANDRLQRAASEEHQLLLGG